MNPIRVNDKFIEVTGFYERICGEGRLLAHQQIDKKHVMAEVVTCTRKEALLGSLEIAIEAAGIAPLARCWSVDHLQRGLRREPASRTCFDASRCGRFTGSDSSATPVEMIHQNEKQLFFTTMGTPKTR